MVHPAVDELPQIIAVVLGDCCVRSMRKCGTCTDAESVDEYAHVYAPTFCFSTSASTFFGGITSLGSKRICSQSLFIFLFLLFPKAGGHQHQAARQETHPIADPKNDLLSM